MGLIGIGVVAVVGFFLIVNCIKVVRDYQRLVVFHFGKCIGAKGPGLVFLIPIAQKAVWVDLREQFLEIPHQTCITKDNAPIAIDFLVYMKVVESVLSVVSVGDFAGAARGVATTNLRAIVGDIALDDVLAKREQINQGIRVKLDEITERWGVKVTAVEIREIVPPREVQDAMNRQVAAERTRRAVVIEAEGTRTAAVTVAEGDKSAAILKAEGARQSTILQAEGERQSAILRAEGYSLALGKIFEVAKGLDGNTMALQYLEMLKQVGASPASKFVVPVELVEMAKNFGLAKTGDKR